MKISITKSNLEKLLEKLLDNLKIFRCLTLGPRETNLLKRLKSWIKRGASLGFGTKLSGDTIKGLKCTLEMEPDSSRLERYLLTMGLFLTKLRLLGFGFNLE